MKAVSAEKHTSIADGLFQQERQLLAGIGHWIKEREPGWEDSRVAISGVGIFIQVTLAGIMIAILAAAGASPIIYSIGIFFAFMADSISFGQAPMRWVLGLFVASGLINVLLALFYGIRLLIS